MESGSPKNLSNWKNGFNALELNVVNTPKLQNKLVVVIGDVHSRIDLAITALKNLEEKWGIPISQVFSVGDLGIFLHEDDWQFLSGPKHHRQPESSPVIAAAWERWCWPLSMIGGNHEPFHRLRVFNASYFNDKLQYTNAGELKHSIEGLRVYGLSGIYHPDHLEFGERGEFHKPKPTCWSDLLQMVMQNKASIKRLTYYKREELNHIANLPSQPDLLLIHDWPIPPPRISPTDDIRRERYLVDTLEPQWVCCGHQHEPRRFEVGKSHCLALNVLADKNPFYVLPGWAAAFDWDGKILRLIN